MTQEKAALHPVDLRSDNVAGAAPEILEALLRANAGTQPSYGADAQTAALQSALSDLFGAPCAAQPVATGTAANALALSLLTPPWGAVMCSGTAHISDSECGAPELFTGGAKILPLAETDGKLQPETLARALKTARWGNSSAVQPAMLSLTQGTERGTLYTPEEIATLTEIARHYGLKVHLDGARFANAVAALGCAPADLTTRAGIDVLSFGGTKNGCLAAEAVVVFDTALAEPLRFRARKAGHVHSKMRFVSEQLNAYVADGLWLRLAGNANAMAARLAEGLAAIDGVRLLHPVQINEIFASVPPAVQEGWARDGIGVYDRGGGNVRLVTAFSTTADQVDAVLASARRNSG